VNTAKPAPSLRTIIVDDEKPARELFREQLAAYQEIEIVGEADRVSSATELVRGLAPELVFLDVQMPEETGFALLPVLGGLASPPFVVFVTAYDTYAVRAFEVNALDYLTKPVNNHRLAVTIERLHARRHESPVGAPEQPPEPQSPARLEICDLVWLQGKFGRRMIQAGEIYAVEAEGDYTNVSIVGDETMFIRKKIQQWELELPTPPFLKVSRRLILNMPFISQFIPLDREHNVLHFKGSEKAMLISRVEVRRIREAVR